MHLEEFCIIFNFTSAWWTNSKFQPVQALKAVEGLMGSLRTQGLGHAQGPQGWHCGQRQVRHPVWPHRALVAQAPNGCSPRAAQLLLVRAAECALIALKAMPVTKEKQGYSSLKGGIFLTGHREQRVGRTFVSAVYWKVIESLQKLFPIEHKTSLKH